MKAAVLYELNKPLVVEDLEICHPKNNQVMVRLGATSICHSDIHCISGDFPEPLPCVLGHECAGYIEEIGKSKERQGHEILYPPLERVDGRGFKRKKKTPDRFP